MPLSFKDLGEREILALAVSLEEEDGRIYGEFAEGLKKNFPATARIFEQMRDEESEHRRRLLDQYKSRFGDHLPLIRRSDVKGFTQHKPFWLGATLSLHKVRNAAAVMEMETTRFYEAAMQRTTDVGTRKLLGDLAEIEREHTHLAESLEDKGISPNERKEEEEAKRRLFVLQIVQPGLAGLMDGSVSTLAPLFAAAFATHDTKQTLLVGLAASVGAGISMGFAEALSDDGALSGRGHPWARGGICGLMTAIGGLGHSLPFIARSFHFAFVLAVMVVVVELLVIAWVRHRYMDTPLLSAAFQVVVGGVLVFIAGILIGAS
ncbi:MAG TPA: ferritin family protein [Chthoniobacteraceae bacterium]|jgi:rubrerythrin|nr:ferritin family protein [Chthoniobacteraceae bacterium]